MATATEEPQKAPNGSSADLSGFDHVREKSLKAAGWSYMVGDAALVTAGILEKNSATARAGVLYGTGGLVLARYGNPRAEKRLQLLYQDLGKHLKSMGAEIPKGSAVDAALLAKDGGIIDNIERFLYRHPSQVLNALFAVGGVELMHGGIQSNRPWKTASGALVTAGGLAGLLIAERPAHEVPHERPGGFFDKAWRWVQDKPLRASGYLYMANNVTLSIDAFLDGRKDSKKFGYMFQFLTVASYMLANALLATSLKKNASTKNKGEEHTSMKMLERAAAEVIAAQPKPVQEAMIREVAGYLSAEARTTIPAEELADAMQKVVAEHAQYAQRDNGWVTRVAAAPAVPSTPAL